MSIRATQTLRARSRRPHYFKIAMSDEEYELMFAASAYTGERAGSWARDVLVSRGLSLAKQRMLA